MARIDIVREVQLPAEDAWRRLTDWPRHGDLVPFTRVRTTPVGFVARTGIGRLGFDDPMELVAQDAPRYCRLEKRGKVMRGWAALSVEEISHGRSRVTWAEEITVRSLPRSLDGLTAFASRLLFGRVVDGLLDLRH